MTVKIFHTVDGTRYRSTYFASTTFNSEQWDALHECPLAIQEALLNPSSTLEIETGNCVLRIKP